MITFLALKDIPKSMSIDLIFLIPMSIPNILLKSLASKSNDFIFVSLCFWLILIILHLSKSVT